MNTSQPNLMNITSLKIKLNIWENTREKNKVMILYDGQIPFSLSDSTMNEWKIFYTFIAYNPLIPPYPEGTQLFRARHSKKYPYELLDIIPILDIFTIRDPGTYFVTFTSPIDGTVKLPFDNILIYVENGTKITNLPAKVYFF